MTTPCTPVPRRTAGRTPRRLLAALAVCSAVMAAPTQSPAQSLSGGRLQAEAVDAAGIERLAAGIVADTARIAAADPSTRLTAYRSALASLAVVEAAARRPASQDPRTLAMIETGRRQLLALAARGLDRSTLSIGAIRAETELVAGGSLSPEDQIAAAADLDRFSADIDEPALRTEAMVAIGRMHRALGNPARAVRYGQLAELAARDMAAGDRRDARLAEVVGLLVTGGGTSLGLVVTALRSFSDPTARATAIAAIPASLPAAPPAAPDPAAFRQGEADPAETAFAAIATGSPAAAAALAVAAAEAMEDDAAVLLACSLGSAQAQNDLLLTIAARQMEQGRDYSALDTAGFVTGPDRVRLEARVAVALARGGYTAVAGAIADEMRADGAAEQAGVVEAAVAAADTRDTLDTAPMREGDPGRSEAAAALDRAARGELREALRDLVRIEDDPARVAALRAVAEARAGMLDVDGRLAGGVAAVAAAPAGTPRTLFASGDMRLVSGDEVRNAAPAIAVRLPDLGIDADAVRAMVPISRPGIGGLSLVGLNRFTRLNRFNSRFLEDVVGTTAREHIFRTQGTINPTFIYLTEGVFTARDLLHSVGSSAGGQLARRGGVYTLRVPLIIGPDATLVLTGEDSPEFRLSADAGAFLVNAGKLFVVDATLTGWNEQAGAPAHATYDTKHEFRPFITAWSGSSTFIAGARVEALGYSAGKSYGLTFSSGPKDSSFAEDSAPRPTGILVDSVFDNLYYGFYTYEADDILVIGNEYRDSVVYALDPHDRSRRLTMAFNSLHGTQKKHGAIFSRDVTRSALVGNLSFDNAGSGFMMDRRSTGNLVYANVAVGNAQDGVTLYESPCVLVARNLIEGNGRSGIKIRNSWSVIADGNTIERNHGPAIEAYVADLAASEDGDSRDLHEDPYLPISAFSAGDNLIAGNGAGITARDASAVGLAGNRFFGDGAAFFDGDLKTMRVHLLRHAGAGRAATALPDTRLAPSAEAAREAGTAHCPPPGAVPQGGAS